MTSSASPELTYHLLRGRGGPKHRLCHGTREREMTLENRDSRCLFRAYVPFEPKIATQCLVCCTNFRYGIVADFSI